MTALHYATFMVDDMPYYNRAQAEKVLRLLIDNGANPNISDRSGITPLHQFKTSVGLKKIWSKITRKQKTQKAPSIQKQLYTAIEQGNRGKVKE